MSKQIVKRINGIVMAIMLGLVGVQGASAEQLSYDDAVKCSAYFITTSALLDMAGQKEASSQYGSAAEYFYNESSRLASGKSDEQVEKEVMSSADMMADVVIADMDNYATLEKMYEKSCIAKAEATMASLN